jgi:WD40 repeat protein/energy-coupling factor transporter ATP-binding protein EcfA2
MIDEQPSPATQAGAFASLAELRAIQARLGERRRRQPENAALWDAVEDFVERGCATGVVLDDADERWSVQGLLDYWAAALERAGRPRRDSSLAEFDPECVPDLPDAVCPYLGLNAFEEKDSRVFFGRDALVDKLVRQLGEHRLVALVGPSGCGKSSLAFAGLVSRLRTGALPGSDAWRILSMMPGAEPRAALAGLLSDHAGAGATEDAPAVVVVVDQFEELFTLCRSEDEQVGFVADLLALVTASSPAHRVVLTVRSDFESFVARHPALYERYVAGRVAVTPPSAAELRQAIEGPAEHVGLKFEAGVIDRLLQELLGEPAGLPLLQFTLLRLWQERRRNRVTIECYKRVGGGRQALARTADAIYDGMIPQDQMTAQRILLLVGLAVDDKHEATRTRVPRLQFFGGAEDPGRVERVLDKLIEARLLRQTVGRQGDAPQVEVAHEALVRNWPRLAVWLQEAQAGLADRRWLDSKVAEWVRRGRVRIGLLDEVELREAERLQDTPAGKRLGTDQDLAALIALSRRQVKTIARGWKALISLVTSTSVLLVMLALFVFWYRNAKVSLRAIEWKTEVGKIHLEQGRALLLQRHPMQALPFLVAARDDAGESPVLRQLFAQASRCLPLVTFAGKGSVRTAAFSPDGRRVVTASDDYSAQVWDAATGYPVTRRLEHHGTVNAAVFSPDGTRVITASDDSTARVWDASTGEPVTPPLPHKDAVHAAAFSPDGTRVVTASDDNTARVWDAATGKPVTPALRHDDAVHAAAFSHDGTRVVTASSDRTARIWEAATGNLVTSLEHRGAVRAGVFSPKDSTRVVTASDHTAQVWDAATGTPVTPPLEHQDVVQAVAFSPDGKHVVTASSDKTARVWNAATGTPVTPPLEHQGVVNTAGFSPDGARVITASSDDTARVWDASTGKPVAWPFEHQGAVRAAAFSPRDSARVVTVSDKTARVWDASTGKGTPPLEHHLSVRAAAFSPDGTRVVTASDKAAQVWDVSTGKPVGHPLEHRDVVLAAAFSPDGTRVVTASLDSTAQIWDTATGKPVTSPLEHQGPVHVAVFSPDGTRVVTASSDRTARVWNAATGKPVTPPLEHQGVVNTAAFSPDGVYVVTASSDKTARVWNAATGKPVTPPLEHQGTVHVAAFSPDGARVVTASLDGTAQVWHAPPGTWVTLPLEHQGPVHAVAFSPDGTRVVTASDDKTARVWNAATGKPVTPPLAHQGTVNAVAFSPDGTRVVTASSDNTARVWDAATGNPVTLPLEHQGAVRAAAFSPDGTRVVTASDDHTARIWTFPIDGGSLEDWRRLAGCSPFTLVDGAVTTNPEPRAMCPRQ